MKYSILFASLVLILAALSSAHASTLGNTFKVGSHLAWVEDAGSTGPDDQRTTTLATIKITSITVRKDAQTTVYLIHADGIQVPSGIKTDVQVTLSQATAGSAEGQCTPSQFMNRECGNLPADMGTISFQSGHGYETHNLSCIYDSNVCYVTGYGTQSLLLQ